VLGRNRRLALLAEGYFSPTDAKTAVGVLRYRPGQVAAVIDATHAGRTAGDVAGVGGTIPVVADVAAAAARGADALLIGVAPQGGGLPAPFRTAVRDALALGWDVLSGLHVWLGDDPEFAALAARLGGRIHDVRRPVNETRVGAGRAARCGAFMVLTVGSDCNVGKMTAALELTQALKARGVRAAFVATGQTGIFVADEGVAVDAVVSDFAAGAIEHRVLEAARDADVVVVEGQGSLFHPGYSGVTLALLHGAMPDAMVLCHQVSRTEMRAGGEGDPVLPMPPLAAVREAYQNAAGWVRPAPVVAVALNTLGLSDAAARAACEAASRELGLPATDPVRFGAGPLADAIATRSGRLHASHG